MKAKKIPAKRDAILSLQFYRDREETPCFLVTSNPETEQDRSNIFTGVDEIIFARNLVLNPNLNLTELIYLCKFFRRVEEELKTLVSMGSVKS